MVFYCNKYSRSEVVINISVDFKAFATYILIRRCSSSKRLIPSSSISRSRCSTDSNARI
ncbi:hypothetical protein M758_UG031600 [Ceratodon purpureus]|nr:hypothetical protein M758_UG031600 [Ceratodon purpureus]